MTRGSICEYAEAVRERYLRGTKEKKGKILGELVCSECGCEFGVGLLLIPGIRYISRIKEMRTEGDSWCHVFLRKSVKDRLKKCGNFVSLLSSYCYHALMLSFH